MLETEEATVLENREIHTASRRHNQLLAGKLVLSYPIAKGQLELGSEVSHTHSSGEYSNAEGIVADASTDMKEDNLAGFLAFSYPLGSFSMDAGLRYEYVSAKYYSFGKYEEEPSRNYSN